MAEETQVKSPLTSDNKQTTEQSVENGVNKAVKKSLPIIANTVSKAIATPFAAATNLTAEVVKTSVNTFKKPVASGFEKIRDIGSDLITDIKETAKDVLSPGGIITTITGSPLLGSFVGDSLSNGFDKVKDMLDIALDEARETTDNALEKTQVQLSNKSDVTNGILSKLLNSLTSFKDIFTKNSIDVMKNEKLKELREAEARREELAALSKEDRGETSPDKEGKTSIFDDMKKNILLFWNSLKSIFTVVFTGIKFIAKRIPILFGIFEFFRSLFAGEDIRTSLTNALDEMISSFLMLFTLPIDLIGKALGKDWDLTGFMKEWTNTLFSGLSALFHGDWAKSLNLFEKFGSLTEKIFTTINDWIYEYLIKPISVGLFKIGEYIGGFIYDYIANPISELKDKISEIWKTISDTLSDNIFNPISELKDKMIYWFDDNIKKPVLDFFEMISNMFISVKDKVKSFLPSWLVGSDDEKKVEKDKDIVKPIIESSKQIAELQRPIQTTIVNNNNNNMTQMSNNNAIGKTNMIIQSSLRNNDPTFNQCIMNNMITAM